MGHVDSGGFSYLCMGCNTITEAPSEAWISSLVDLEKAGSEADKDSWARWVNFWFAIKNAEVEIS